jgi:hypothetical protein
LPLPLFQQPQHRSLHYPPTTSNSFIEYSVMPNKLFQGNIRLVTHITKRFANKGDTEEFIQESHI